MRSWEEGGATIDVGEHLPALAARAGLRVELLRPLVRVGPAASPEWRWLGQFFRSYLPKVVDRGLLGAEELDAWLRDWDRRTSEGAGYCLTPVMADVVLRKP